MESVEKYLIKFVNNPYNDEINYELAYAYECEEQYAAAVSYYLRCAEFTEDNVIAAEALIRLSLCINNQEGRDEKSLYFIKHAITASPNSIEPYYIASLYFSWRSGNIPEQRMWLDSYTYACMGINILENNLQTKPFKNSIGYDKHDIYYQKAWTGSKIGKIDEAREIYTHILSTFDINENVRENVENIKNELPEPNHPIISYSRDKIDKLKFKFENSDKIKSNFSQIYQDMFVLSMYNGKSDGAYLEIGAGHYDYGNNTYLLEKDFNWNGISIDINKHYTDIFNNNRENNCLCADATKIDYLELLDNNYGSTNIDYLQLDCDPPNITFDILTKIPFNKYKFGVITYEHDFYNDTTGKYREKSREFLKEKGYKLIAGNISPYKDNYPFEDWWIHPQLIDENIYKLFERDEDIPINGEKYMLSNNKSIITSTHSVFEMDNQLTTINKSIITFGTDYLFKNQKIRFKQQAADINFFDSIIIEDEDTIKPLIKDHEDFIKNNQRGYGYWLWKPLIIKRQLEKMTNNDILFYLDSGSSIINNNIHKLNNYIDILQNKDIIVFDDRHRLNKQFTKRNVINEFNLNENILNSPIIEGGCIILKKSKFTTDFVDNWLYYMTKDYYGLVTDDLFGLEQSKGFTEGRHDQTILGILARQYDNIYIANGHEELYDRGPLFHTRLTDTGPRKYAKPLPQLTDGFSISPTLESLGIKYKTDKIDYDHNYNGMNYCNIYEKHFHKIKDNVTKFVEIGIKDGNSLRMWKEYFPNATIYGIDIDPNCKQYEEDRIICLIGNQNDELFLLKIRDIIGEYDILLDDGSHIIEHQIKSFNILYEKCNKNGFYIIEDLRCSYEEYLNHHDIRNCWPGMKFNDSNDELKNYRSDFNKFTEDKVKKLDFHNSDKMFAIYHYPMIIIFENYDKKCILTTTHKNKLKNDFNINTITRDTNYSLPNLKTYNIPNLIVIDDFYENPDEIRNYALSLEYQNPENHGAVGYRCESGRKILDGTKELFENLMHKSIPDGNKEGEWNYITNGCFQWCNASVPIVYHSDSQQYAGIIYLTPNAPPNTGTSFLRHKKYKIRNCEIFGKSDWYESELNYKEPHLDKTPWEMVDSIGNVYNRLVIFNARNIHAVTEYFGENIENSRLFQLFFFNLN